jgi:hypothetical protein
MVPRGGTTRCYRRPGVGRCPPNLELAITTELYSFCYPGNYRSALYWICAGEKCSYSIYKNLFTKHECLRKIGWIQPPNL